MKLFDYKFLLTLGLCLIVYFLYREVDILTKRVIVLENGKKEKKTIELIELPPNNEEIQMLDLMLDKPKHSEPKMVEEYSNDHHHDIYSHDNLHTNTNDNDTLMVESILNMVKDDITNNIAEVSVHIEQDDSEIEPEKSEDPPVNVENKMVEHLEESDSNDSNESNVVLIKDNVSNKISLETLNKKKLDELQELASKYNIDINYENGKKKKKSDLAQEIFNKQ
jgi:hypothetical protein